VSAHLGEFLKGTQPVKSSQIPGGKGSGQSNLKFYASG
jgi:hypothetical protein